MSLNSPPPLQLGDLAAESDMASKRSVRAYVDEDDGLDDTPAYSEWKGAALDELESLTMERQSSAASSNPSSCDEPATATRMGTTSVDLGRDLADMLQPQAPLSHPTTSLPSPITSTATPPVNFGVVVPGMYRSGYPAAEHHGYIRDLKLKTIVTLVDREYPDGYKSFMAGHGIHNHVFTMRGTKKEAIPVHLMKSILRLVLDRQNHPLLIHCNHGKHRTGCVIAIIRKLSGWSLPDIIDEYRAFAYPKIRDCDVEYITNFQLSSLSNLFRDAKAVGFRVPNFFRTTFFTIFVLAIWMISGSRMAYPTGPAAENGDDNSD